MKELVRPERFELPAFWFVEGSFRGSLGVQVFDSKHSEFTRVEPNCRVHDSFLAHFWVLQLGHQRTKKSSSYHGINFFQIHPARSPRSWPHLRQRPRHHRGDFALSLLPYLRACQVSRRQRRLCPQTPQDALGVANREPVRLSRLSKPQRIRLLP